MRSWLAAGVAVWLVAGNPAGGAARGVAPAFRIATGAGPIVRIGCRQGECSWQQRRDATIVRRTPDEAIVRLRLRVATTVHGVSGRIPSGWRRGMAATWRDETDYVRCSKRRPALLWRDAEGGVLLHELNLLALGGYQLHSADVYMLACHSLGPDTWGNARLTRLGYGRSPSDQTEYDTLDAGLAAIGVR